MSKFIVFEGGEGVGKSTQLELLKEYLERTEQKAVFTREPGGTPLAEKIRRLILTEPMCADCESLLFAAQRAEHIENFIKPELEKGNIVVCDRYLDSSLAYQGYARGLTEEKVLAYNDYAVQNCLPDAIVFIDMDPTKSWRRRSGDVIENDRLEKEADAFHSAVYKGFQTLAEKNERYIRIVPDEDKLVTAVKIVEALRGKGIIK